MTDLSSQLKLRGHLTLSVMFRMIQLHAEWMFVMEAVYFCRSWLTLWPMKLG